MDQGSKALPSSIRGLAHLMRLVLEGRGLCAGALGWVSEVSSPFAFFPSASLVTGEILPGSAGHAAPYCNAHIWKDLG